MQKILLDWFDRNKRTLPWRTTRTPYRTWISEIMLQQTRVETVIPYFLRWMELFPDVATLAASDEQSVLKCWEGLGYYHRARALHQTAIIINQTMGCVFPSDPKVMQKLPGIGRYTAGAIASIAFGMRAAALDGNIRRVYSRTADISLPLRSSECEKILWQIADELLDPDRPGDYNEALMDLGNAICTSSNPRCESCPIQPFCLAYVNHTVAMRPVLAAGKAIPHYQVSAAVIRKSENNQPDRFLLAQRPANGLLGNLWEFPGGKIEEDETAQECLQREIREELNSNISIIKPFGTYRHAYTHFRVTLQAFLCEIGDQKPDPVEAQAITWAAAEDLDQFPMGKIDRLIAQQIKKI